MLPSDPRHGTNAGYIAHAFAKETACQPCKDAHAAYGRSLRAKRYINRVDRLHVSPIPTQRRLQALAAIGWSWPALHERLGYNLSTQRISALLTAKAVHIDTERKIAALYEELHMTLGPSAITRKRSERKGWLPPLAWDNIADLAEYHGRVQKHASEEERRSVGERVLAGESMKALAAELHRDKKTIRAWRDELLAERAAA